MTIVDTTLPTIPRTPVTDDQGRVTVPWQQFFIALWNRTNASSILDGIDSTPGDLLYRGPTLWQALKVGTAGQFLRSNGSLPVWQTTPIPYVNALSFAGVDPTGVTDSRAGLQAAWDAAAAAGTFLYVPAGTYLLASTSTRGPGTVGVPSGQTPLGTGSITACLISPRLAIFEGPNSVPWGGGIVGDGVGATIFNVTANATGIACRNIYGARFEQFSVVAPTKRTHGFGIDCQAEPVGSPANSQVIDNCIFRDLHIVNQNIGIIIGGKDVGGGQSLAGFNFWENIRSESNTLYGFQLCGEVQTINLYAALNGSHGFFVASNTGTSAFSCGQWRAWSTFENGGWGVFIKAVSNNVNTSISTVRLSDFFIGEDALGGIFMDSYGITPHMLSNIYCESNTNTNSFFCTINNPTIVLTHCVMATGGSADVVHSQLASSPQTSQHSSLIVTGGKYESLSPVGTPSCISVDPDSKTMVSQCELRSNGGFNLTAAANFNSLAITNCYLPGGSGINIGSPAGIYNEFGNFT